MAKCSRTNFTRAEFETHHPADRRPHHGSGETSSRRRASAARSHRRSRSGRRHHAHSADPPHRARTYFGRKPHTELNPDEVVALGAAVQANILERGVSNMLLLDVTPLSLGIETYGGAVAKIIPRNSTIPASAQEMYTTGVDNQTGIDIHVLQGERELAKDCRSLARFTLKVPPAPAGLPRIEVAFLIDANGILQVAAKDLRTGEQHSIEVQPSYGINDTEIERMLEESIEYAEQDFAERQVIEARTESEAILAATAKALNNPQSARLARRRARQISIIAVAP